MVNRIVLKDQSLTITDGSLITSESGYFLIPIDSINDIQFYEPSDLRAGYIGIVTNDMQNADIVFFHKDQRDYFKEISNKINSEINIDIQKQAS